MSRPPVALRVVMPAYNEAGCIVEVVRAWLAALPEGAELEVVDDGSRDGTPALLDGLAGDARLRVVHQANRGHGPTVHAAYRRAVDDGVTWVFQVDSDGQFDPADLPRLWARREEAPFVWGIRACRQDPAVRKLVSAVAARWVGILFGAPVRDPNIPFRLMRADALAPLLARVDPEVFAPNLLLSALARPMVQMEVRHLPRAAGAGHLDGRKLARRCVETAVVLARFRLAASPDA